MGLFNILDPVLSFIFNPLIDIGYFPALFILALVSTFAVTFLQKKVTDQELLKRLKEEVKELQQEMKTLKDNPERAREVQRRLAETNMNMLKQSLKPSLYTMIPFIIILGWLGSHIAYLPIMPGDEFTITLSTVDEVGTARIIAPGFEVLTDATQKVVDNTVAWGLKAGQEGMFTIEFEVDGVIVSKAVTVTSGKRDGDQLKRALGFFDYIYSPNKEYLNAEEQKVVYSVMTSNKPVKPFGETFLPGWMEGWIATYIMLSLVFNIVLKKVMKVY
jgi:uncharacterized membrane protein (DUF106 family)